jgi:hypothetical protein
VSEKVVQFAADSHVPLAALNDAVPAADAVRALARHRTGIVNFGESMGILKRW